MSEVKTCELGDLIEFQRGYDLPKSEFRNGPYPVQSSNGILGYHIDYKVEGPGITIGRSGTVGIPHYLNENFYPHNTTLFVKDFKGNDRKYIYYLLKHLKLNDFKTGSGVPTMNRNHLHPLKVNAFIDKNYQVKLSSILSILDQKIALNNQINEELEAMAKTLYDYWFVQFDFPDENGKPYKSSGGKMVYNDQLKREIPEGWGVEKLENIANITMGQSPKGTSYNEVGEGMLFFQGSTDFGWRFPVARQYTTEPSRIAEEDDILLSVRAPVGTLNIADTRCCIGRGLAAINSKVGANSYIFNVMQDFKKLFDMMNSVGTTFGSITKDDLYSLKLIYPPNELLMKFDKSVNSFDREIKNRSRQNQELTQLRDWLLPMLMNGQARVEDKT
ncbi:restriction endonuclease subunit S [Streptococcus sp. VTCC 12886]|uniref:restriction endonuclease subunit S n=1 Tax=Streptococcus sp. VTCC 12886 TaxID=3413767 RepID=UPI003D9C6A67